MRCIPGNTWYLFPVTLQQQDNELLTWSVWALALTFP